MIYVESTPHVDSLGHLTSDLRDSTVKSFDRDGHIQTVQALGTHDFGWEVLSPDGTQMLWTDLTTSPQDKPFHSELHLTSFGQGDRVIAAYEGSESEPYGSYVIAGYRWDFGGAIVAHRAAGAPMPLLLADVWEAYLFDPKSGTLSSLWPGSSCTLPARAADGTVACVLRDSGDSAGEYTLNIGKPPDIAVSVRVAANPGLGSLSFKPGPSPSELVIGLNRASQAFDSGAFDYSFGPTLAVNLKNGNVRPFGPSGMMPPNGSWAWLDDGTLIEYDTEPAHTDPATAVITDVTYLVSSDGSARRLTDGLPVGVLRG